VKALNAAAVLLALKRFGISFVRSLIRDGRVFFMARTRKIEVLRPAMY
jgi:hypothetical protein